MFLFYKLRNKIIKFNLLVIVVYFVVDLDYVGILSIGSFYCLIVFYYCRCIFLEFFVSLVGLNILIFNIMVID